MNHALPLRPLHLPPAPDWWPPAPGWWLLAGLLLMACLGVALGLWLRHRRHQKLARLDAQLARCVASPNAAVELHRLLRRAVAPLLPCPLATDEADWVATLERLAGMTHCTELMALEARRYQLDAAVPLAAQAQARTLLALVLLHPRRARKRLAGVRP